MARVLSEEDIRKILEAKNNSGTKESRATMDNGATYTQMRYLSRIYENTGYEIIFLKLSMKMGDGRSTIL